MSITFLIITCTDCTFRGSSLVTAGRYLWNDNGRTFQFDRRLGHCLDCNKVVAIEDLPDAETMERARSIQKTYVGQPLFSFIEPDYAKYLASQDGFDVLEQVIELNRQPVCLQCGKSAVRPINQPEGLPARHQSHSTSATLGAQARFRCKPPAGCELVYVLKRMFIISTGD